MATFSIDTIFRATDKFSAPIKSMSSASERFAQRQAVAFTKMKDSMLNVRNQLIGLAGGLSIAALFREGYTAIVDYNKALHSLSAVTGVSGKDFEAFKIQVMDVANKTHMSAVETAKAFEIVGSAKSDLLKNADALSKVTEASIILSKAAGEELEPMAKSLTGVMNQFAMGAADSNRIINVLAAGNEVGAASIAEISAAMDVAGSSAHLAEMSIEETTAAIAVFSQFNLKGSEAGTKLSGVMSMLQRSQLGYKSGVFNLKDGLIELRKNWERLGTAQQKDAYLQKVLRQENKAAGIILMQNLKTYGEFTKAVTGTDTAFRQSEEREKSFAAQLEKLKNKFDNLIISGNESSGALNVFGKVLGFVTNNLGLIIGAVGTFLVLKGAWIALMTAWRAGMLLYNLILGISAGVTGVYNIAIGKSVIAMRAAAVMTKIWTAAQWLINAALIANPIGVIIMGIAALIAGIVLLIVYWDKVKKKMDEWGNSAIFQIIKVMVPILAIIDAIAFLQDRWDGIKKAFTEGGFIEGIKAIGATILSFILKPIEVILGAIGRLTGWDWAEKLSGDIANFRSGLDEGLVKPVNPQAAQVNSQNNAATSKSKIEAVFTNKTGLNMQVAASGVNMPTVTATNE